MQAYEILTTEQLEKHREILLWMLAEVDLELARREKQLSKQISFAEPWLGYR